MASLFLVPPSHMEVVVRVRPLNATEIRKGDHVCLHVLPTASQIPNQIQIDEHLFDVDRVYNEKINQRDFFHKQFANSIKRIFEGLSVSIFACGSSSSGKTYTMEGFQKNHGVAPRAMFKLFQCGQQEVDSFRVEMSLFEVSQNQLLDFLVTKTNHRELFLGKTKNGRVAVEGITTKKIGSYDEFFKLYDRACKSRQKSTSNYHSRSYRSHCFLQVRVESRGFDGIVNVGHLHLIDLASQDDVCPTVQESASMMLDLQPVDDNPVSMLLSDSVVNATIATMVCAVSPAQSSSKSTLKSLQYAAKKRKLVEPILSPTPSIAELTPKAKPATTPTLDTTAPWSKRRQNGKALLPMKRLRLHESNDSASCRQRTRLKTLSTNRASKSIVPQPNENDIPKHLLTMAVDFEKRGKGRTAIALYKQAHALVGTPHDKLEARIRVLEDSLPPLSLDDLTLVSAVPRSSVHSHIQKILEVDLLETLNSGSMSKLLELQGVGEKKATKIYCGRSETHFYSIRDLVKIGMGERQVNQLHHLNITSRLTLF